MALSLQRRGIHRVRPLEGGLEAWSEQGLPLESEAGNPRALEPRERPTSQPTELGDSLIFDEENRPIALHELWKDGPVVLAFVRQFGCMLCRAFVIELEQQREAIQACGANIAVVGNGEPEAARRFRELFELDVPVFVDPHRRVFDELGFRRNLGGSANPAVLLAALRAWLRGARQGKTEGDPWQLGGVLIVQRSGEVSYRHASRHAGDHPSVDDIVRELDGAE